MHERYTRIARSVANVALMFTPDIVVAYLYTWLDDTTPFLVALSVLLGARVVFWLLTWMGEALAWYLVGRRVVIGNFLNHFRELGYPIRTERVGFTLYLHRLPEGRYPFEIDPETESWKKKRVIDDAFLLKHDYDYNYKGRMRSAIERAFELYSPLSVATKPA